jgi:predicted AAA+ superfamily ATPase
MIQRTLAVKLKKAAKQYPIITLTGPRQSGKSTLVKMVFPDYEYVSLENPDHRQFSLDDPRGFIGKFQDKVILDEIQRAPDLFSYIQTIVDEQDQPGQFILTGSQNFLLLEKISQSLAGRTAIYHLMPFSKNELLGESPIHPDSFPTVHDNGSSDKNLWQLMFTGFYPRIHDKKLEPREWIGSYYQTYIERDVRSVINVGDLENFGRFIRLCAGRVGQLINFASLAADCGISNLTAKRWLSVLQASFIIVPLQPHYQNFSKRLIKSPKLYFLDTGLLSFLLGIRNPEELRFHALRGAIFESFVFSELYKSFLNFGLLPNIYFWHDVKRHEVDFLLERGNKILPVEAKAGETITSDQFKGLIYYRNLAADKSETPVLVYAGKLSTQQYSGSFLAKFVVKFLLINFILRISRKMLISLLICPPENIM